MADGIQRLNWENEKRERKREQNRIAQRNYRLNQKKRIQALEAVAKHASNAIDAPISPLMNETLSEQLNATSGSLLDPTLDLDLDTIPVSATVSIPNRAICDDSTAWPACLALDKSPTPTPGPSEDIVQHQTPLHLSIRCGNESMTRLLLRKGADLKRRASNGSTALHFAAETGQEDIVKLLLGEGCSPNATDNIGRTALFRAVQRGDEVAAQLLLGASTDVNLKDIWGNTALHLAVETGSESLALLLLENGAHVDASIRQNIEG